MADGTRYAIVQWEDNLTSIISLQSIKCPRKPITQYLEGDYVTAPFGRQLYKARISEISGKFVDDSMSRRPQLGQGKTTPM